VSALLFMALSIFAVLAFSVLVGVVKDMTTREVEGWLSALGRLLVRAAAARLPQPQSARYEEEWLGELSALADRPISALVWATGTVATAWKARRDVQRRPTPSISSVRVRQTGTMRVLADSERIANYPSDLILNGNQVLLAPGNHDLHPTAAEVRDAGLARAGVPGSPGEWMLISDGDRIHLVRRLKMGE
jgi:hypothetical protein